MKLKKKFVISNVIMIILPIMLFVILWAAFTAAGGIRTSGSTTQNVLYFYNNELSQMKWNALYIGNEGAREMLLLPEEERVKELYDLGYHLKVTSGEKVLFCNTDDSNDALIDSIPIDSGIQQIISKDLLCSYRHLYALKAAKSR